MTDDLVKRLRSFDCIAMDGCGAELRHEAADRIEELHILHREYEKLLRERIEELEAEIKLLSEGATIAHLRGAMDAHASRADDLWAEFKDRWEGEKKFALREVVKYLKEKGHVDTAVSETDGR
jgi:hypothetical protein